MAPSVLSSAIARAFVPTLVRDPLKRGLPHPKGPLRPLGLSH